MLIIQLSNTKTLRCNSVQDGTYALTAKKLLNKGYSAKDVSQIIATLFNGGPTIFITISPGNAIDFFI